MSVVVDASAVIDFLFAPGGAMHLRGRLQTFRALHAPHLIDLEVLHFVRARRLAGHIDDIRAAEALADHLALPIKRYAHHMLLLRAWELHPNITAYDAIYVALAESIHATLITSDAHLAKAAARFVSVEAP